MRLAQALERMEAAAETLVDADDSPHLAVVRRLARRVRHGTSGDPLASFGGAFLASGSTPHPLTLVLPQVRVTPRLGVSVCGY